jgi:hypothetical protein
VTSEELKHCRTVHRSLALRLDMLKARLRTAVLSDDLLGLGTNYLMMGRPKADRVAVFTECLKNQIAQTFDQWLDTSRVQDELDSIIAPMADNVIAVAGDGIARYLKPAEVWTAMSDAFDSATKDQIAGFAIKAVKGLR